MGSGLDFNTDTEVFRKDHRLVLARNRHLASIIPARIRYAAAGYVAGTVMGRNSVSGEYMAYSDAGASGEDTAVGVLMHDISDMVASRSDVGQIIVKGEVFEDNLTGLDANAKTDLKSRSVIDGSGVTILIF